jgi:hypothetical protein
MRAKITRVYRCAPEGHTTVQFSPGDVVDGAVAEMAMADHAAAPHFDTPYNPELETKIEQPPEIKRPRGRPRKEASE